MDNYDVAEDRGQKKRKKNVPCDAAALGNRLS
jgi:hypothetical protein